MAIYEYECLNPKCGKIREEIHSTFEKAPKFGRCECSWSTVKVEMSVPGYRRDHTVNGGGGRNGN